MPLHAFVELLIVVAILALGAGALHLIRRKVRPNYPLAALGLAVPVVLIALSSIAPSLGIPLNLAAVAIPLVFAVTLWMHPDPITRTSLQTALAFTAGLVAVFAALAGNLVATAIAIGVTGGLAHLAGAGHARQPADADAPDGATLSKHGH